MRSPPLLSLFLLVIRLGRSHQYTKKFKKFNDLENVTKILKSKADDSIDQQYWDIQMLHSIHRKLPMVLDNHKELFFCQSLEENNYKNSNVIGIQSFIQGGGQVKIAKKWKKLIEKG